MQYIGVPGINNDIVTLSHKHQKISNGQSKCNFILCNINTDEKEVDNIRI